MNTYLCPRTSLSHPLNLSSFISNVLLKLLVKWINLPQYMELSSSRYRGKLSIGLTCVKWMHFWRLPLSSKQFEVLPSVLEICDDNIIVISPEMKNGYCYLKKINYLIILLYKINKWWCFGSTYPNTSMAQLTPMSSLTKTISYCNMRIVIHKRYAKKWKFIDHVLSCHNSIHII